MPQVFSLPGGEALATVLPRLLPAAIAWAGQAAAAGAAEGLPLDESGRALAARVGVRDAARVRVHEVDAMPAPPGDLGRIAEALQFLGPGTQGLTLDHTVFILRGRLSRELLAHELRHVHQVEVAGSLAAFLAEYLRQFAGVGYWNAPYEVDARAHEGG